MSRGGFGIIVLMAALAAPSGAAADIAAAPMPAERPQPTALALSGAAVPQPRARPAPPKIAPDDDPALHHDNQAACLARAIYFEARGEPIDGQFAVARVVLNRLASPFYPDDVCAVVYQGADRETGCQFSFTCDSRLDEPQDDTAWALAVGMAEALLRLERPGLPDEVLRSTHYHATHVRPSWAPRLMRAGRVGRHIFYVSPRKEAARSDAGALALHR